MFTLFDQEWVTQVHEEGLVKNARAEGRQEGELKGRQEGKRDGTLESLRNLMDSLGFDSEQAMSALKVPASEQAEYRKLLELRS